MRSSSSEVSSPALSSLLEKIESWRRYAIFSIPLVKINIGLLADQVGVATAYALDFGQGIHDFLFAINVGVEQTQDELEVALLPRDES